MSILVHYFHVQLTCFNTAKLYREKQEFEESFFQLRKKVIVDELILMC